MIRYSQSHEWVRVEEEVAIIGITAYAQKELGEIVYIEFPEIGKKIKQGDELLILESTKAAIDLYTPLSGTIVAVNETLRENPEQLALDPMGKGWLVKIIYTTSSEIETLLDEAGYQKMLHTN